MTRRYDMCVLACKYEYLRFTTYTGHAHQLSLSSYCIVTSSDAIITTIISIAHVLEESRYLLFRAKNCFLNNLAKIFSR